MKFILSTILTVALLLHRDLRKTTCEYFVSGGDEFTLVLRLSGAPNANMEAPFSIFAISTEAIQSESVLKIFQVFRI